MMRSFIEPLLAALAFVVIGFAAPHNAIAAEIGDRCYSPEEASKLMANEGALFVIMADHTVEDKIHLNRRGQSTTKLEAQFVYLNPEARIAYVLESDKSLRETPSCVKIVIKLHDSFLLDGRLNTIDPIAQIDGDRQTAARICQAEQIPAEDCYHNDRLVKAKNHGLSVFFQGTQNNYAADGHQMPPTRFTILGEMTGDQTGIGIFSTPEGASTLAGGNYEKILYAPKGLAILEARVKVTPTGPQ